LLHDWLEAARRRLEVQQALEVRPYNIQSMCQMFSRIKLRIGCTDASHSSFASCLIDAMKCKH
jgi:hypothetical protein